MKVLLVDIKSGVRSKFTCKNMVSLALRKLCTYYLNRGHEVEVIESGKMPKQKPDLMCFSTIFLFNIPAELGYIRAYQQKFPKAKIKIGGIASSLRPDLFREKLGDNIELTVGLDEEFDRVAPNYVLPPAEYSYGFTSRGCINKCKWCVVPKLEGELRIVEGWENQLGNHDIFRCMDNNAFACGPEHFKSVMQTIKDRGMKIDFNQALDAVVFAKNPEFARIMKAYKPQFDIIRFAWDSKRQDKYIDDAVAALKGAGCRAMWYMLYGFGEPIEEIHARMIKLLDYKQDIKLMRYRNIEDGSYRPDLEGWHVKLTKYINGHFQTGSIGGGRCDIAPLFPPDINEFKKTLLAFNAYTEKVGSVKSGDLKNIVKMRGMVDL